MTPRDARRTVAYFSMEIGLDVRIPTYSGGLGILAGDTIRAAADLKVAMVAVTLLRSLAQHPRRLMDRGLHRRRHWLGHRRGARRFTG